MLRCFLLKSRHGPVLLHKKTTHERVFQRHKRPQASRRRVDLSCVRVSVSQLVGATLYVTHTYVWRLFRFRRFCADDLDETLFAVLSKIMETPSMRIWGTMPCKQGEGG